jgi:hypothetical protein
VRVEINRRQTHLPPPNHHPGVARALRNFRVTRGPPARERDSLKSKTRDPDHHRCAAASRVDARRPHGDEKASLLIRRSLSGSAPSRSGAADKRDRADCARSTRGFVLQFFGGIHPSAHKHGIADEDIEDDDTRLYLGPSRSADLLEVVTIVRDDGSELAVHAMKMRPKYRRLLPGD